MKIKMFAVSAAALNLCACVAPSTTTTQVSEADIASSWRNVSCSRAETDSQRATCVAEHQKAGLPAELPGDVKSTQPTPAPSYVPTESEPKRAEKLSADEALQKAQTVMAGLLKDPYSAHWDCKEMEWGSLGSGKAWGGKDYAGWILPCYINAKNRYGGYTGNKAYGFLFSGNVLLRAVEFGTSLFGSTQRVIYDY